MRNAIVGVFVAVLVGALVVPAPVVANGPEAGVSIGAVVPYGKYRRTVDGNVGGALGLSGGYRFSLTDQLKLSLVAEPSFIFLPTAVCCDSTDDETASLFVGGVGPKITAWGDPLEASLTVQGAYYRDMSGPMTEYGPGVNGGLDVRYRFGHGTSAGLFGRYHWADMDQTPDSDGPRRFLVAGLSLQHVYLPPERVAEAPPPPPPPPPAPTKRRIVLRGVNFDFDKATIRPDAAPILDEAIRTLGEESVITIAVEGHTDAVGTDAYNQGLSERRAGAVAEYMATGGIERSRMTTQGFGESQPVATNATPDGRAQNRRVELRIVDQ
jgi:outer membrane protein OmpA-like peptidoglycan-associated protein